MNKAAAIKEAVSCVAVVGNGSSWTVIGPYRGSDPSGPSTEVSEWSFERATNRACAWRASIALGLLGVPDEDAGYLLLHGEGSTAARVASALSRLSAT